MQDPVSFRPSPLKTALTAGTAFVAVAAFFAYVASNVGFSNVSRTLAAQGEASCGALQARAQDLETRLQTQSSIDKEAALTLREQAVRTEAQLPGSRDYLLTYEAAESRLENRDFIVTLQEFRAHEASRVLAAAREAADESAGLRLEPRVQNFLLVWWKTGLSRKPADQLLGVDFKDEKAFAQGMGRLSQLSPDSLLYVLQQNHKLAQARARQDYESRSLDGSFRAAEWARWIKRFEETGCDRSTICRLAPPPTSAFQFAHDYAQADSWGQDGSPKTEALRKGLDQTRVAMMRGCPGIPVSFNSISR